MQVRQRVRAKGFTVEKTLAILALVLASSAAVVGQSRPPDDDDVAVGAQYDSTHVYVAPSDMDAFVTSFAATFAGTPSKKLVTNVLPVPSSTEFQYLWTPVGTLSVFGFETPIPYPFGQERTGYLVTNMALAIRVARATVENIFVDQFKDPIGQDAIIQWPGGVNTQLYWHTIAPSYANLQFIPENRMYLSADAVKTFLGSF